MAISKQPGSKLEDCSRKDAAVSLFKSVGMFFKIFHPRKANIIFKEVHLNPHLRADILAMDWDDKVTIIEIKSCKEDFKNDDKWKNYMDYCDYLYFLCPEGAISDKDLPANIGLVWASGFSNHLRLNIIRRPKKLRASRLNSAWFRTIYKRLAFRRFAKLNDNPVCLDDEIFF